MCRVLSYIGEPSIMQAFFYEPDNSFIKQSYQPKYMSVILNLAGFGMAAWDNGSTQPERPFLYKTSMLPFYDDNLRHLSGKIAASCFLAHLRGVPFEEDEVVTSQNVHPFLYPCTNIAMAHNGSLYQFDKIRFDLLTFIKDEYKPFISGTTDSEWIYAIFLSQLREPFHTDNPDEVIHAIIQTFKIIKDVRSQHNIAINSPINLFLTNGKFILATRYVLDYGWFPREKKRSAHVTYHSLWYTYGERFGSFDGEYKMKAGKKNTSIIIASEPLTEDTTTWLEVPEYTLLYAHKSDSGDIEMISKDIDL